MSRYYFHLHNHVDVIDEEGVELPDMKAVRAAATLNARDEMAHDVRTGDATMSDRIEVENAAGEPVLSLKFSDVVIIHP